MSSSNDRARSHPDPASLALPVPPLDQHVQLGQRADLRDEDEVDASEAADVALDPAFSWAPTRPGRQ
ncbi:hypothetical protein [Streptomyces sp. NBC_00038]|uniref:hypothetical protein n=1 Tax=Streptomyces sp. NBC_00038 TaxID=2903615 RepID=UPI0022572F44|nr:hypothetical protein [Streptomyces sp. NBC_00038]MCX5554403.1 hypothetical protein [Streptomyces sp. NBC_00038]